MPEFFSATTVLFFANDASFQQTMHYQTLWYCAKYCGALFIRSFQVSAISFSVITGSILTRHCGSVSHVQCSMEFDIRALKGILEPVCDRLILTCVELDTLSGGSAPAPRGKAEHSQLFVNTSGYTEM